MKQIYNFLRHSIDQSFSSIKYNYCRIELMKIYKIFFAINKMYGRAFLANLLVYCPINVVMSTWIMLGSIQFNVFVVILIAYQFVFIFMAHLGLAYCTKHFHRPAKLLITLMVGSMPRVAHLRGRLRLSNDIAAIHVHNRYGFTYGNFGLVSLATFMKVK